MARQFVWWSTPVLCALVLAVGGSCSDASDGNTNTDAGVRSDAGTTQPDAGEDDGGTDAGTRPGIGQVGAPCTTDANCESLICLATRVCSMPCEGPVDCPNSSWQCGQDGSRLAVCVCAPTEGGDDICDGVDNDCNGVIDDTETAVCAGLRVCLNGDCACANENICGIECVDKLTNTRHCGVCNHACDDGASCEQGVCNCAGTTCNDQCVDTSSDNLNCGGCNTSCDRDSDCAQSTCGAADREWTRWPIVSGLMQSSSNDEVFDLDTNLVWQKTHSAVPRTPEDGAAYCASLAHPEGSPWRLPTRAELLSIVDYDRDLSATTEAAIAPGFVLAASSSVPFWTATPVEGSSPAKQWWIDFSDGRLNQTLPNAPLFVRCVRTNLE